MDFLYDGFHHNAGKRCFQFRRLKSGAPESLFSIDIEMALLARHGVALQEAPLFCMRLLNAALELSEADLQKFQQYEVGTDDFREVHAERAKRNEEIRLRRSKLRPKTPPRNPSLPSELFRPKPTYAV